MGPSIELVPLPGRSVISDRYTASPPASRKGTQPQLEQRLEEQAPELVPARRAEDDQESPRDELSPAKPKKSISFYMSILMLALVALTVSWDSTTLAVATPTITSQLGGTTFQSFWANIAFMLCVVVTQPIYSSVSNVLGRKIPLLAATTLFTLGCIIFAVAKSMSLVIAGRTLQGLGGGGLDVLQSVVLSDITTLKERPLYLGIMSLAISIGTLAGPVMGALFTEYVSWRWIGWINLPIMAAIFLLTLFFLRLRLMDLSFTSKLRRLDWIGMMLFTVGATLTALPLSWANDLFPWASWQTLVPLIIGGLVLVIFAFYEKKPIEPIIPHRIFANITFITALISGFLNGMIMYSLVLYIPLFFQAVYLQEPLQAALSALPLACVTLGFAFLASVSMESTRRYRLQLWAGWILTTVFLGLWSRVGKDTSKAASYIFQSFLGVGVGTVFTTTTVQLQASVELVDDMGLAAGLLVFFRLFGALLGQTIGATVFNSVFQQNIAGLKPLPEVLKILEEPSQAIGFIPALRELDVPVEIRSRLQIAYQGPFETLWIVMAGLSCVGAVASFLTKELSLEREDVGRQGFEGR